MGHTAGLWKAIWRSALRARSMALCAPWGSAVASRTSSAPRMPEGGVEGGRQLICEAGDRPLGERERVAELAAAQATGRGDALAEQRVAVGQAPPLQQPLEAVEEREVGGAAHEVEGEAGRQREVLDLRGRGFEVRGQRGGSPRGAGGVLR